MEELTKYLEGLNTRLQGVENLIVTDEMFKTGDK